MSKPRIVFCTKAGSNFGMGHLKRCASLAGRADCLFSSTVVLKGRHSAPVAGTQGFKHLRFVEDFRASETADLIVTDMRDTNAGVMRRLTRTAPVVSLDDGKAGKKYAHITVSPLPVLREICANYHGPEYMIFDSRILTVPNVPYHEKKGTVVSFGGSDPHNLTGTVVSCLNTLGIAPDIVRGPFFEHSLEGLRGNVIDSPPHLHEIIAKARVLVTSFGITMYEAFFLGTPVVLFNHSSYHSLLAHHVSAINLGYRGNIGSEDIKRRLAETLGDEDVLREYAEKNKALVDGKGTERVVSIMKRALSGERRNCLLHHSTAVVLKRTAEYTLFLCRKCGDLFLYDISEGKPDYEDNYFLKEYRAQYGKTYIEDRKNIARNGMRRLECIERLHAKRGMLLDVGCALGFFVECAVKRGWNAHGLEVSRYASTWGKKTLGVDIIHGSFLDAEIASDLYDVVTFFYVVEHCKNAEKVFEKAHRILKKGGIIVIALPNRAGISYRVNKKQYIENHPKDHYFDITPRTLTKVLKRFGFQKRKVYVSGIHPERFFSVLGLNAQGKVLRAVYTVFAKIFRLGDTFEYYGRKK
jgi:spore coat polysaccharide biosynthesis predicted glycosyltransferase SpsG/SAM-dependent methyltransferase